MTREEHLKGVLALKAKAQAAHDDGRLSEAMLISSHVAELILEHPEFWPKQLDPKQLKADCERLINSIEKQLGIIQ